MKRAYFSTLEALKLDNITEFKLHFVREFLKINDENHPFLLHEACRHRSIKIVRYLVKEVAVDIDTISKKSGQTALHEIGFFPISQGSFYKQSRIIDLIFKREDITSNFRDCPTSFTIYIGFIVKNEELVLDLLKKRRSLGKELYNHIIFQSAIVRGFTSVMKYLLDEKLVFVHIKHHKSYINEKSRSFNYSALLLAIQYNQQKSVDLLLERGALLNFSAVRMLVLIHQSCKLEKSKLINLNIMDESHNTPLHIAVSKNDRNLVQDLLSLGADPNICYSSFFTVKKLGNPITAFYKAAYNGNIELAKLFVFYDQNLKNKPDSTPLHYAALYNYHNAAELLIKPETDLDMVNSEGQTISEIALAKGHNEFVKLIENIKRKRQNLGEKIPNFPSIPVNSNEQCSRLIR